MIDPIDLIWRSHQAGEINDLELITLQASYAPRCSFDNNPAVGRDGNLFLCLECATVRLPEINARYTQSIRQPVTQ